MCHRWMTILLCGLFDDVSIFLLFFYHFSTIVLSFLSLAWDWPTFDVFIVASDVPFFLLLLRVERSDENRQRGRFKRIDKIRERKLKEKKIFDPDAKQRCELFETSRRGKAVCIFRLLHFWFLFSSFFFPLLTCCLFRTKILWILLSFL